MDRLPDIALFQQRLDELGAQMAEPSFYANPRQAADVMREHQRLAQLVADYRLHAKVEREIATTTLALGVASKCHRCLGTRPRSRTRTRARTRTWAR